MYRSLQYPIVSRTVLLIALSSCRLPGVCYHSGTTRTTLEHDVSDGNASDEKRLGRKLVISVLIAGINILSHDTQLTVYLPILRLSFILCLLVDSYVFAGLDEQTVRTTANSARHAKPCNTIPRYANSSDTIWYPSVYACTPTALHQPGSFRTPAADFPPARSPERARAPDKRELRSRQ